MYVFSLYIDYWLGLCQLWDFFNWSTVKVYVERMPVSIIPIQLQRWTPVLSSLIARRTNIQTNSSNRPQPSATEVKKLIDIPQFTASAQAVSELMDKKTTVKYWHCTPLFRGWCMRRPSWSWLKCLKTILPTECRSYNYQLEFCRSALDLLRNFSKCAFSEIKTRARSRPRTPFWRSLVLGWRQALRHSPQGVSRNVRSTNVGHLSELHLTDQNQCSYPNYILPC